MKDNNKKMTLFYRKLNNNEIESACEGVQSLEFFTRFNKEERELLFGMIVMDYNALIFDHYEWFNAVEENGEMKLKLKEEYKQKFDMSQYF